VNKQVVATRTHGRDGRFAGGDVNGKTQTEFPKTEKNFSSDVRTVVHAQSTSRPEATAAGTGRLSPRK